MRNLYVGPATDYVTRYNHRRPGLLDAPRVHNPYRKTDVASWLLIAFSASLLIVLGVMILQAL